MHQLLYCTILCHIIFLSLQITKPNYSFILSLDVLEGEIFLQNLPSVVAACVLGMIFFTDIEHAVLI
jgi:hypothetical protein